MTTPAQQQGQATAAQIRALAGQLAPKAPDYPPASIRKAVVTSLQDSSGSLTITLSGDGTQISGVQYVKGYYPVAGDVVLVHKQGNDIVVFDTVATSNGKFTHHEHSSSGSPDISGGGVSNIGAYSISTRNTANDGVNRANNAQSSANNAQNAANNAYNHADGAYSAANNAQGTANAALSAAQNAQARLSAHGW